MQFFLIVTFLKHPFTFADANLNQHLETPVREALLRPRNYNPHPYQHSPSAIKRRESYRTLADHYAANDLTQNAISSIQLHPSLRDLYNTGPLQFPTSALRSLSHSDHGAPDIPHPYARLKHRIRPVQHNSIDVSH